MACHISVSVQQQPFDQSVAEAVLRDGHHDIGAVVSFTGYVRDEGGKLTSMTLEHYPGMTEAELTRIAEKAADRWPLVALTVIHRFGKLLPGDPIVLVLAASSHRKAAFEAAEFVMDFLKNDAPFWKLEEEKDGESKWVSARDSDTSAKDRWQ